MPNSKPSSTGSSPDQALYDNDPDAITDNGAATPSNESLDVQLRRLLRRETELRLRIDELVEEITNLEAANVCAALQEDVQGTRSSGGDDVNGLLQDLNDKSDKGRMRASSAPVRRDLTFNLYTHADRIMLGRI